jgi:hypothetical protein
LSLAGHEVVVDREQFSQHLHRAAIQARECGQGFVLDTLPEPLRFHVMLNCSYDGNPLHADERVFPEDGSAERAIGLLRCTEHEAIEALWRDGLVPEWIDVYVAGCLANATLVQLECCGRFTANAELLYHQDAGLPPFQVMGPWAPWDHPRDAKLSLSARPECCSFDELDYVAANAAQVRSLTIYGPTFDDAAMARLRCFRNLEELEARISPLRGWGLRFLDQGSLHTLRLRLYEVDDFSLQALPELPSLQNLGLINLPPGDWAGPDFAHRTRWLKRLRLWSRHTLELPTRWPPALTELRITAPAVRGGPIPTNLQLWLRLNDEAKR